MSVITQGYCPAPTPVIEFVVAAVDHKKLTVPVPPVVAILAPPSLAPQEAAVVVTLWL